jgi:transcriptional regulator with XRE-family HTH domain
MAGPRGKREASRALALGALVRKLRRHQGLTQEQVGKLIPISSSSVSRIELGVQGPPEPETIERIAAALGADPGELLRAAGRTASGQTVEDVILAKLDALRREVREIKVAIMREPE